MGTVNFFGENSCAQIKGKELSSGLRSHWWAEALGYDSNDHCEGQTNCQGSSLQSESKYSKIVTYVKIIMR